MTQLSMPLGEESDETVSPEEGLKRIEQSERELLRFLEREYGTLTKDARITALFLNLFLKAGHVRLPLNLAPNAWGEELELEEEQLAALPDQPVNADELLQLPMFGSSTQERVPYIIEGDSAYINKYRSFELDLLALLNQKSAAKPVEGSDEEKLEILYDLYEPEPGGTNHQMAAAALSLIKPLLFISGGPGTGKTTTVARILALHQKLAAEPLRIAMAAPTGKAAGRMGEALHAQLGSMNLSEDELSGFPDEAVTIHRLLSPTRERGLLPEPEKKMLRNDLIVVDEASMIDLTLMHRLLTHIPEKTRLILLGDRHQLASVEAGSVFADLCRKPDNRFSPETTRFLNRMGIEDLPEAEVDSPLQDCVTYLTRSYRFDPQKGIGRLAAAVLGGEAGSDELKSVIEKSDELTHQPFSYSRQEDIGGLLDRIGKRIESSLESTDPQKLLQLQKEEGWLVSLRRGPSGTRRLNRAVEERLPVRVTRTRRGEWYHGRAVMITRNDYRLGIFNGDMGVCIREEDGTLRVHVESGSRVRPFRPERLRNVAPAYFITVHKSQGSEFDRVNVLLPNELHPIFSRELIYTAITRARKSVAIYGSLDLLAKGIGQETVRYSGLSLTK